MEQGLYEQLINKLIEAKLRHLDRDVYFIHETPLDRTEAAKVLSQYLTHVIHFALNLLSGDDRLEKQIHLSNAIIKLLRDELPSLEFDQNLIIAEAKILSAIFKKLDAPVSDIEKYIHEITPYTRLSHSELFTGNHVGVSMESELKKEILSSDKVYFLVSFIKWAGIRIFERELNTFTSRGGKLQVITTSYLGATDLKAVEFLSRLPNTEIKISYNTENERLHAKAYLFYRNTGFHTGYIGSSNLSRSALTNGLEWNLKVTTQEVGHIIDKFQKTFDTYWQSEDFEPFVPERDTPKLQHALRKERVGERNIPEFYFDIKPFPFQEDILEKLDVERQIHQRFKNLIVAATGTGKTVISAFDYNRFKQNHPRARLLFIAHRKEILDQALATFRGVLRDNNFGDPWVEGIEPVQHEFLFASIQTLNNRLDALRLSPDFYDFIIVDEVHHISAASYRPVLSRFHPKILLGLTATPERMDGANILEDFCNNIAAEIRLPEALNRRLLCPFQYFGITDSVDLQSISWRNGRYVPGELTRIYTENDRRVLDIIQGLRKYLRDDHDVRALGFCVTQDHASYMAEKLTLAGYKADYLVSDRSQDRDLLRRRLREKEINYLFVVDIFNEGVDIPEIDTVLFLRPTESLTVFLQQLGRGLRLSDDKECLTVLDFVGQARAEYDFAHKFRALVGKTNTPIHKEIADDFPHLPLGCTIVLERKAKEYILENIRKATRFTRMNLIQKIQNFRHQSSLPLTLQNFCYVLDIPIPLLYKRIGWMRLCQLGGLREDFSDENENEIKRAIAKKWLSTQSRSYFSFILHCAQQQFVLPFEALAEKEQIMCLMLHYDIWNTAGGFPSLSESLAAIGNNVMLVEEINEVMEMLLDKIDFVEYDAHLPYPQPLHVHSRYTRDQILAAFGFSTFHQKSPIREGVAFSHDNNTELLFITLKKSESDFSPTTLYDDFAISDTLFHWQSQNATSPESEKGQSYIHHERMGKKILLFVRERNEDEYGNTMGFVFLGEARYVRHEGSKPMSITWELKLPMPHFLWSEAGKLSVG